MRTDLAARYEEINLDASGRFLSRGCYRGGSIVGNRLDWFPLTRQPFDRVDQGQFRIYWAPGSQNIADYFTKHHSPAHHRYMQPIILNQLHPSRTSEYMRGCAESPVMPSVPPKGTRRSDGRHRTVRQHAHISAQPARPLCQ